MSLRLPTFQSGRPLLEQVTADKLNQLVDAIRQCELQGGVGYDVNRNSGGSTLTIRQQGHQYVQGGAKKLIGPSNSGMSHTDAGAVVNPGVESYNFFCKTPTGSYTTAFVHGITFSNFATYNTSNNLGKNITMVGKRTAVTHSSGTISLSEGDLFRRIGLEAPYSGNVETALANAVTTHASECAAVISGDFIQRNSRYSVDCGFTGTGNGLAFGNQTGVKYVTTSGGGADPTRIICSGTTYIASTQCTGAIAVNYYTFGTPTDLAGCFVTDTGFGETVSTGNYTFKRIFDLGLIPSSSVRMRLIVRMGTVASFVGIKLNGSNATYTTFETQTSTYIPLEITEGFVVGQNEVEVVINSGSATVLPSVSFQFLSTTATIESATGFSALTAAQKDLIGDGTPVQVTVGTTSSLYAYNGSGDKGTTAAYTFLRDV